MPLKFSRATGSDALPHPGTRSGHNREPPVTLRASLEDLRAPNSREMLRQHFNGAFPETQRRPFQEWTNEMGTRDSLSRATSNGSVGQNSQARSSSTSLDSAGVNSNINKRLSTVRESNPTIDIEQAIHILQELKKSASPEQLVALHKALLPTRDSIVGGPSLPHNEDRSSVNSTAGLIRRKSMVPPGLATRGGASQDLLIRREDIKLPAKLKRTKTVDRSSPLMPKGSESSLVALDLADDAATLDHARAATPADLDHALMGAYRPGTLRITNGAASPEPGIATRPSIDLPTSKPKTVQRKASRDYATASTTPIAHDPDLKRTSFDASLLEASESAREALSKLESNVGQDVQEPTSSQIPRPARSSTGFSFGMSGVPVPLDKDELQPPVRNSQRPHRSSAIPVSQTPQSRDTSATRTPRSRDASLTPLPLRIETLASRSHLTGLESKVSRDNLGFSRRSLEPLRPEVDDGKVSPVRDSPLREEVPRFAQRWSHRASKITSEGEPDVRLSGYVDGSTVLSKMNTVLDAEGHGAHGTAAETPDAALSKLNGLPTDQTAQHPDESPTVKISELQKSSPRYYSGPKLSRPPPQKEDSGYGTDACGTENSLQEQQSKASREVGRPSYLRLSADEGVSLDDDAKSLYTSEQTLKKPLATPPTPNTSGRKKHFSLLRLTTSRRGSANTKTASPEQAETAQFGQGSPVDQKAPKQQNKLQKSKPKSVRREGKAVSKTTEDHSEQSSMAGEVSAMFNDVATTSVIRSTEVEPITALPSLPATQSLLAELGGDTRFMENDQTPAIPKRSLPRKRSKRSTHRNDSQREEQQDQPQFQRPRASSRKRSASDTRNDRDAANARGLTLRPMGCMNSGLDASNGNPADDLVPLLIEHESLTRSPGCSPYDISTNLLRRTVAAPGALVQSPDQVRPNFSRSKSGGLVGMDSGMASELARMKSRDVAVQNNEFLFDRPRTAKPKSRGAEDKRSRSHSTARVPAAARKDCFSDSNGSSAEPGNFFGPVELPSRSMSTYSESIPPMPELPTVSKVDEMVAKRIRQDSARPSPDISGRSSEEERNGFSNMSIAEAVTKAKEARKKQAAKLGGEGTKSAGTRPHEPRQQTQDSLEVQVRQILRLPSTESIQIGYNADAEALEETQAIAPELENQDSKATDWEQHAKLWRQRRKSLGESLGRPVPDERFLKLALDYEASASPAIVVSRYVTPYSSDHKAMRERARTVSASEHANAYRELIGEDSEDVSAIENQRADNHDSVEIPSLQEEESQLSSARNSTQALYAPNHASTERARSPGGRVITQSGNYHPYTPADASRAERSRAQSLAKLTSAGSEPSPALSSVDVSSPLGYHSNSTAESLLGRYSGGLQYGFERGAGIGGSAGTRVKADASNRKSRQLSEGWGLDLSDVPVFLTKVQP
ncbi:hypothetical protein LTR37_006928 [Vermiconidia calcicola]|uniref:Uncharacterized protein n=1 Tax=Vermiconidia calcicola TaxID=1690605 RepID=A0ACC3NET7_9PEZI|nr:hypothetical protein LTR37_006928 [Vermiconidia calcicola]